MPTPIDLQRAREDVAYFSAVYLLLDGQHGRPKLYPFQLGVITDAAPTVVWSGGRQVGKTLAAVSYLIWRCWTESGHRAIYISYGQRQSPEVVIEKVLGLIAGTPLERDLIRQSDDLIRVTNRSSIHFPPGQNPPAVRGLGAKLSRSGEVSGVTVIEDEAHLIPDQTDLAAMSVINAAPEGAWKIFKLGSGGGMSGHFYRDYCAGLDPLNTSVKSFQTSAENVPHIPKSTLLEHKSKMTPTDYECEVRGNFIESISGFFAGHVEAAITPYSLPWSPPEGWQLCFALDLSSSERYGTDFTVLIVAARDWTGRRIRLCEIRRFQFLSQSDLAKEVREIERRYPCLYDAVAESYESLALQEVFSTREVTLRLEIVNPSNPLQRESFSNFHRLLRNREVELPTSGDHVRELLRELRAFSYKITDAGNVTYSAPSGQHDDLTYALNWCLYGLREKRIRPPRSAAAPMTGAVGGMREREETEQLEGLEKW